MRLYFAEKLSGRNFNRLDATLQNNEFLDEENALLPLLPIALPKHLRLRLDPAQGDAQNGVFAIMKHDVAKAIVMRFTLLYYTYRWRFPTYNTPPWTPAIFPLYSKIM